MVNTFISPVIGKAVELGVSSYEDSHLVELHPNDSSETVETLSSMLSIAKYWVMLT